MTRSNRNFFIILALIVGAAAFGTVILMASNGPDMLPTVPANTTFERRPAPDFELELFSGKTIKLSDFRDQKPVVLNFWASWCPPCREEAPVLSAMAKRFGSDVEFIGVVVNDTQEKAQEFIDEFGVTYENGHDRSDIGQAYKVTGVPETFWIDTNGQIIDHWIGAIDEDNLEDRTERLIVKSTAGGGS